MEQEKQKKSSKSSLDAPQPHYYHSSCNSKLERQVSTHSDSGTDTDTQFYRVLYDYQPNHDDELALLKDSLIKVLSKDFKISGDDGWWTGVNVSDGKRGIFPSNYVELCSTQTTESLSIINTLEQTSKQDLPPHIEYNSLEFRDCIGAGGFGKVYRGYWLHEEDQHRELVAIKEARVEGDKDDLLACVKQNVIQEAKLFWMLRHPNIIQLKGICFQEPHFCLIMEYAKGGSLGRLLNIRKIGFPPNILIKWALQVSQGMYYLHKIPIIHRDLKSSNILLSEDAVNGEHRLKDIVLKLTDFGLARELQKTTNEMSTAGTYSHMPPEVIKSSTYSKASDVWSFGVLLWELLTGEVPYKGIDPLAIAYGVAVNKLTLPIPSSCPKIFSDLIHGCWHTDPYKRLTFEQIIDTLTEISNSTFATTSYELFWTMQQDWKSEIKEMFDQIKDRENELRTREEELERISMRQQAYENMLRQRERELEEREKDLAVRELTVALQQLNPLPPEPKKRRKGLLTNFLRSTTSSINSSSQNIPNLTANHPVLTNTKSIDISSPSDFQHCLSVQPESTSNLNLSSTPTEDLITSNSNNNSNLLLSPVAASSSAAASTGSPNLRLKIMLIDNSDKQRTLVHQRTLSPNQSPNSRERLQNTGKSNSVDISREEKNTKQQSKQQKSNHTSRSKYQKSNSIWQDDATRSTSADLNENNSNTTPSSTKKITKILYEIGSILSFVGLGKDYKQQQQQAVTRRCQDKKHTTTTTTTSSLNESKMLLPCQQQSHSLTRLHKTYPYRFKSLTSNDSPEQESKMSKASSKKNLDVEAAKTAASVLATNSAALSSSSSNLLSPKSHLTPIKYHNQEILKKYSKSVDCTHYLDAQNNNNNNINTTTTTTNSLLLSSSTGSASRLSSTSNLCVSNQNSASSTSINSKVQRQQSVSTNYSPLIPRRSDYEPVARVTIQRQQRIEQSPSSNLPTRPLTLDLRKAFLNGGVNNYTLSTASTNEDDFLVLEDEVRPLEVVAKPKLVQPTVVEKNRDSLSLSISSSIASSSVPSSISPVASPRLAVKQLNVASCTLRPSKSLNSQSSVTSSNSCLSPNSTNQK